MFFVDCLSPRELSSLSMGIFVFCFRLLSKTVTYCPTKRLSREGLGARRGWLHRDHTTTTMYRNTFVRECAGQEIILGYTELIFPITSPCRCSLAPLRCLFISSFPTNKPRVKNSRASQFQCGQRCHARAHAYTHETKKFKPRPSNMNHMYQPTSLKR